MGGMIDFNRVSDVYDRGRAHPLERLTAWRDAVAPLVPAAA
jgi:hypothetical protein